MKTVWALLLIVSCNPIFAQDDIKARIEYEAAESAFSEERFETAISHITKAEAYLGRWTSRVSYLKILSLDKVCDYTTLDNDYTKQQQKEVALYMNYAKKNPDDIDVDKFKIIYAIEDKIQYVVKTVALFNMEEYVRGTQAYENKDYNLAMENFLKAAQKDNYLAMNYIGVLYNHGFGVSVNTSEAMKWFKKAAEKGEGSAMTNIGLMYYNGNGVSQNYSEALSWFKKAADKGEANAPQYIAYLYHNGQGVPQNYSEAMFWYNKAVEKNVADAMLQLGWMYYQGQGVKQNYPEALNWYKKAAENANAQGMFYLAEMYFNAVGTAIDMNQAVSWYEKAANLDHVEAMNKLGYLHSIIEVNEKAVQWYKRAAEKGSPEAMNQLGFHYFYGKGVAQDHGEALTWYIKAAESGNQKAFKNIEANYETGIYGVKKEHRKRAKDWLANNKQQ